MNIIVSAPTGADIGEILEIEYDSQPEPWTERSFMEEVERESLFVARLEAGDRRIAGYICFWSVSEELQILNIAVRRALRRQGIARKLIEFAVRTGQARQARVATLEVRESNLAARRLYESLGFRITGERPGYYGTQSESAILMEFDIPG